MYSGLIAASKTLILIATLELELVIDRYDIGIFLAAGEGGSDISSAPPLVS